MVGSVVLAFTATDLWEKRKSKRSFKAIRRSRMNLIVESFPSCRVRILEYWYIRKTFTDFLQISTSQIISSLRNLAQIHSITPNSISILKTKSQSQSPNPRFYYPAYWPTYTIIATINAPVIATPAATLAISGSFLSASLIYTIV